MLKKLTMMIPTGIFAVVLTVAPTFAQDARDPVANDIPATRVNDYEDDGPDLGWLGLLGLLGLAGLIPRNRTRHVVEDRHPDRSHRA